MSVCVVPLKLRYQCIDLLFLFLTQLILHI